MRDYTRLFRGMGFVIALGAIVGISALVADGSGRQEKRMQDPTVVTRGTGSAPPSDAIVLFDGKDLSEWTGRGGEAGWEVKDRVMIVKRGAGDILTKRKFGDMQLHIEWASPAEVKGDSKGQGRGNSGVYIQKGLSPSNASAR